jgi:hypothetical protein
VIRTAVAAADGPGRRRVALNRAVVAVLRQPSGRLVVVLSGLRPRLR